jgi:hypothetical protein
MESIEHSLDRLERARRHATGRSARCLAHEGSHNSLSVAEGEDGKVLLHCFASRSVEVMPPILARRHGDLWTQESAS